MHKVLFYYGVILSSSFSGNSQPRLSRNPAAQRITLSARYGQYQGWLTTSHTNPFHSPRYFQLHQSGWVLLSLSWFWEFFNFESQVLILFHLFLLSSKDILVRWHSNVDNCPLLCVFVYYSSNWTIALQPLVRKSSAYPKFVYS